MTAAMNFEFHFADPGVRARAATRPSSIPDLSLAQCSLGDFLFAAPSAPASAWKGRFDPFAAAKPQCPRTVFPPGPPGIDDLSRATKLTAPRSESINNNKLCSTNHELVNDFCRTIQRELRSIAFADRERRGLLPNPAFDADLHESLEAMNVILALRTEAESDPHANHIVPPADNNNISTTARAISIPAPVASDILSSRATYNSSPRSTCSSISRSSNTPTPRATSLENAVTLRLTNSNNTSESSSPDRSLFCGTPDTVRPRRQVNVTSPTPDDEIDLYDLVDMGASLEPCSDCTDECHCLVGRSFLPDGKVEQFDITF